MENVQIIGPLEENGALPVNVQDQTTPIFGLYFLKPTGLPTTLASGTSVDDRTVTVASSANFSVGNQVGIFSSVSGGGRFFFAEVLSISVNDITIDTPLDHTFAVGDAVIAADKNMNVDGSSTPQIFELQGGGVDSGICVDIVRLLVSMECSSAVDLSKFGNLSKLTNGVVLRKKDGEYRNIFNVKSNSEISEECYDITFYESLNPSQGIDGMTARCTFGGQSKRGAVVRLEPGETLQLIIQDNLTGLVNFSIKAHGHIVLN